MDKYDLLKNKEYIQGKTKQIIENYKEKAGVNKDIKVYQNDNKIVGKNTVPTWLENGETWENPHTGKKWKRDKHGRLSAGRLEKREIFSPKICPKCKSYLQSPNDINIRLQTGKCIKCHSDEEIDAIIEGREYEPPSWKNEILIKDTTGKIIMDIDEYHQEYGDEMTFLFLNKLVSELDEKRENGIKINEGIYENAKNRRDKLKEKINNNIEEINSIVTEMMENDEISEDMTDDDLEKVLFKIHKNKQDEQK